MGSLCIITPWLALADPVPHRIDGPLVGAADTDDRAMAAVEREATPQRIVFVLVFSATVPHWCDSDE
jgi:hypothetical protein